MRALSLDREIDEFDIEILDDGTPPTLSEVEMALAILARAKACDDAEIKRVLARDGIIGLTWDFDFSWPTQDPEPGQAATEQTESQYQTATGLMFLSPGDVYGGQMVTAPAGGSQPTSVILTPTAMELTMYGGLTSTDTTPIIGSVITMNASRSDFLNWSVT